jgi:putative membrane protein
MRISSTLLVVFVVVFHLAAFVLEAVLWMRPGVYSSALSRLGSPSALPPHEQALVLQALFVNQGFYNLFLAIAGISGLALVQRGRVQVGLILIAYMCLTAVGAGIVLALSTRAYIGAVLQCVPAALALLTLRSTLLLGPASRR